MSTDWHKKTAHEIRDAVRAGKTTALEVTESHLARIEAVDGKVRAFTDVWSNAARDQAKAVDARIKNGEDVGVLAGVPIGLKDVFCTKLGTTTCCSKILKGYRSPFDGTAVERLQHAVDQPHVVEERQPGDAHVVLVGPQGVVNDRVRVRVEVRVRQDDALGTRRRSARELSGQVAVGRQRTLERR